MHQSNSILIGYCDNTPLGRVYLALSDRGLCRVSTDSVSIEEFAEKIEEIYPAMKVVFDNNLISEAKEKLEEYFSHRREKIDIPLDLSFMTLFEQKVLESCSQIDFGETVSYGELALRAGSPKASRAVGNVMKKNPIPIVIPCHRVIAASGKIGGYTGGLHKKRTLLALENVYIS